MNKNNNRGSSMALVIVLLAVIFTLGGAILSVLNSNYKVRAKENNRLQNLYEAEAGLDVAYNIIVKVFDAAVLAGNDEVEEELKRIQAEIVNEEIDIDDKEIEKRKNKAFKSGFEIYIDSSNEFKECINNNQYIVTEEYKSIDKSNKYKNIVFKTEEGLDSPKISYNEEKSSKLKEKYKVVVDSTFQTNTSTGVNKRDLQVTYNIEVPDYEGIKESETEINVERPIEIKNKLIAIDGNMRIEGNVYQQFSMDGDIFVKGNEEDATKDSIVYEKYKGGIEILGNNANVNMLSNVVTTKTFNLSANNSKVSIQDLYAGNVYIGNKNGTSSKNNEFNADTVMIDNDLAIKSNDSEVEIDRFYGINDKNFNTYTKNGEEKTSSSIIVNNDRNKESSIEINEEAYIMGTAYINAKDNQGQYYQTGESVAIKGNYIAYTHPLESFINKEFKMYGNLQMVDSINGQKLNAITKSKYFEEFMQSENNKDDLNTDIDISLPQKTYAAGAIVYKKDGNLVVERSTYTTSIEDYIKQKRIEYATKVCMMDSLDGKDGMTVYENQSNNQKSVSGHIVNFNKVKELDEGNDKSRLITGNNTLVIRKSSEPYTPGLNERVIDINGDSINALVINNGNVKLVGDFEFNGTIIASGNLDIIGRREKSINYNENIVNEIISSNFSELQGIFNLNSQKVTIGNMIEETKVVKYKYQYDTKKYITSENWKITK